MNFLKQFQNKIKEESKELEEQVIEPVIEKGPLLAEGIYPAVVQETIYMENVPSKYGGVADIIEITYAIFEETDFGVPISHDVKERYYISQTEHSKYARHLKILLGEDPRVSGYSTKDLVGVAVEVRVKHNFSGGKTYENVEDVRLLDLGLEEK